MSPRFRSAVCTRVGLNFTFVISMSITSNMEDYLERIYLLIQERQVARVKDIAESMNVKNPSVNNAITELKKLQLVEQEPYGYVTLTPKGLEEAQRIIGRHRLLCEFLSYLGVSPEVAEQDACNMEHYLNDETLKAIGDFCQNNKKGTQKPSSISP